MSERLFIATPAYGRQVTLDYHISLLETVAELYGQGIAVDPQYVCDSLITRARNILVSRFLNSDCTHFLFIDSDLGWKPEAALRLLWAMRAAPDVEAACVMYPLRALPQKFPVNLLEPFVAHPVVPLVEATRVPTGFLMLKRSAFERMIAAYPERAARFEEHGANQYAFFDCLIENGDYISEDFGFSTLFRRAGGRIWVDPEPTLRHVGPHEFVGRLADHFTKAVAGNPAER